MALTDENGNKIQEYYYNACLSTEMYMKAEGNKKGPTDWSKDDTHPLVFFEILRLRLAAVRCRTGQVECTRPAS